MNKARCRAGKGRCRMTTRRLDDIPGYDAWKLMTPEDAEESYGREMFDDDDDRERDDDEICGQFYDGGWSDELARRSAA